MFKEVRQKGVSLAELLVVLAITVVLAAILMPALATPGNAGGNPEAAMDAYVVAEEGPVDPRSRAERRKGHPEITPAMEVLPEGGAIVELVPALDTLEPETLERDGLERIKTTDISYPLP